MNHFIEKKVEPFCVQAYHNGEFKEITEKNLLGMPYGVRGFGGPLRRIPKVRL